MAAARQWLYGVLHGDVTLMGLGRDVFPGGTAPESFGFPFITFQFMSGLDYAAVGAYRIWTNMIWLVKTVGETADVSTLDAIMARIDVLLHRGSGTPTAGIVWACVRESTFELPETIQGKQFRSLGGTYRLYAT
jgi:hypothetical protein